MQASKSCLIHINSEIEYICLNIKCIESRSQIMCKECTQEHNIKCKGHQVIDYPLLKKYLQTFRKQIDYEELKQIIEDEFKILKQSINKSLSELSDFVLTSFSLEFNQEHQFQIFQGEINLLTRNELFKKYVTNTSSLNLVKQQLKSSNMYLLKELRIMTAEVNKTIQNFKKDLELNKNQMINNNAKSFLFSQKLKHQNIEVLNQGTTVKRINKQSLGHSQLAVCRQPFSPINNKIQFVIKDMSSRACIAFGACFLPVVRQNKYFKCWQIGEGTYSIFQNTFGFVKSNHNSDKHYSNSLVKNWKFKKGDIIKVEIDFMKERINFEKNQKQAFFWMPINIEIGKLYPFVALSFMDDLIQIK